MEPPKFLSIPNLIRIQQNQIGLYGGLEGIRDMNLLEFAAAVPSSGFGDQFYHEDIFAMAAAYLFHIIKDHPFVDGNKRAGAMAAYVFLNANGYDLDVAENEFERICLGVAEGCIKKDEVANFFREAFDK